MDIGSAYLIYDENGNVIGYYNKLTGECTSGNCDAITGGACANGQCYTPDEELTQRRQAVQDEHPDLDDNDVCVIDPAICDSDGDGIFDWEE